MLWQLQSVLSAWLTLGSSDDKGFRAAKSRHPFPAAPKFARWSEEFASTVFIKVDVDKARDVASSQGISAMPTFKFYKDNACIETIQGFSEQKIAAALGKLGKKEK